MREWAEILRTELDRYQRRTGQDSFSLSDLYLQAVPRVQSQRPQQHHPESRIRDALQTLDAQGDVERREEGVYRIRELNSDGTFPTSVSEEGKEILEQWQRVASTYASGDFFDMDGHYDTDGLKQDALSFVSDPTLERFETFWDRLNSASRRGSGESIYNKWVNTDGKSADDLADLISRIIDAETYSESWESALGAKWTVRELFGQLHIEENPSITGKTTRGLELFGYPKASSYEEAKVHFEDFKLDYMEYCGHASSGTDHEAAIHIEMDQLLRVIDAVDADHLDDALVEPEVRDLYQLIIDQRRMATPAMIGPKPRELGLSYVLRETARRYPGMDEIKGDESERSVAHYPRLQGWLKTELKAALEDIIATTDLEYTIRGGMGQGTIAYDPYIAVFDSNHSESTQHGLYIVYLFDPAEDAVFLTLNQGAREATKASHSADPGITTTDILERSAEMYRTDLGKPYDGFIASAAGLTNDTDKAKKYNAGAIWHRRYGQEDLLPDAEASTRPDLIRLVDAYSELLDIVGSTPDLTLSMDGFWRLSPGEGGRLWTSWKDAEIATVGLDEAIVDEVRSASDEERSSWRPQDKPHQLYDFVEQIEAGDLIIAGASKDNLDRVYGIGVVTAPYGADEADQRLAEADDIGHDRAIGVNWFSVAERGLPVTITSSEQAYHVHTVDELSRDQAQQLSAAACRKLAVVEGSAAFEPVATRMREELEFTSGSSDGDDLPEPHTDSKAPYYWVNQSKGKAPVAGTYLEAALDDNWAHNLTKLDPGDIVFNYHNKGVRGYSTVTSEAYLHEGTDGPKQRINVEYTEFDSPVPSTELYPIFIQDEYRLPKYNPMGETGPNQQYLHSVNEAAGKKLLELGTRGYNADRLEERLTLPEVTVELPDGLYYPPEQATSLRNQLQAGLNSGKHVVFTGPPGTGKSKLATHVCSQLRADGSIDGAVFTTATAEWTAYDTVGGYMPSHDSDDGALEFSPGQFLRCFRTSDGDVKSEWLIIDELNRSNIDKAFGQLFSVLSGDSVELPYERDEPVTIEWVDSETPPEEREAIAMNPDRFPDAGVAIAGNNEHRRQNLTI